MLLIKYIIGHGFKACCQVFQYSNHICILSMLLPRSTIPLLFA